MSAPVLRVSGLSFRYPGAHRATLDNLSFSVMPGERVALLGPNGAGKSTLLLALAGVIQAEGVCEVAGLSTRDQKQLCRRVGLVFQDTESQLFMPTVFDDVAFGPLNFGLPEAEVKERVRKALASVGCEGYEARVPHQLSGGERRRIALATVLAMDVDILLLDEPTTNLDPRGKRAVLKLLGELGKTLLIATHDLDLAAQLCPRSLLLDRGRLYADRPTSALLSDTALLDAHGL